MKPQKDRVIIVGRVNYSESDRIITCISISHGKLSLLAKGSRKPKSKLVGGIELLSLSEVVYVEGKGDLGILTSARMIKSYSNILKNLDKLNLAGEVLRVFHTKTHQNIGEEYYRLLELFLSTLNDNQNIKLIRNWFLAQFLGMSGHLPNLLTDDHGAVLLADRKYDFDYDQMCFREGAYYSTREIKLLRLLFSEIEKSQTVFKLDDPKNENAKISTLLETIFTSQL